MGVPTPTLREAGGREAGERFQGMMRDSANASRFGAAVEVHSVDEYAGMRLFASEDSKAGFALDGDNFVSVLSAPDGYRGIAPHLLTTAVDNRGQRLDAYDTVLPIIYA